jgi:Peptidase family M28
VVLNLESRGSSGPAVMFQTSDGNRGVVSVYGRVAPHPVATSVAVEVYRLLSNDTDFTPVLTAGRFTGLNAAYIDGSSAYHSPLDRPSNVDVGSLQAHGDNALALAREFGRVDLGPLMHPSSGDETYFPLPGGLLLRYPGALNWPLAVLALLAVAVFGALARRRGLTSVPRLFAGLGLALLPLIGTAVLAQLYWSILVFLRPGYGELIDPHRPLWFRLAVAAFTLFVVFLWYGLSRRKVGPLALAVGASGLLAVLGVVFAALIPGGSYLTALPALAGALAGIGALLVDRPVIRLALLAAGAAVGVVVLTPAVTLFFPALGLAVGAAPAMFAALLCLTLLPALEYLWRAQDADRARVRGSAPAAVAFVLGLMLTGVGLSVDRWDADHPIPTHLMYALDADTGTARWVSLESSPGPWTRQYVTGHAELSTDFPVLPGGRLAVGPAPAAGLAAPTATVDSSTEAGGERTVKLTIKAGRAVRLISFYGPVGDTRVVKATVEGRDVVTHIPELDRFGENFNGPPDGSIDVTLVLRGSDPYTIRVIDGSDGLSDLPGWKPRPADVGVIGSHSSELVAVGKTYTV